MSSDGWETLTLDEVAHYQNGRATKPAEARDHGMLVVKIRELNSGVTEKSVRVDPDAVEEKHKIRDGDLLFAWSASVGIYVWRGEEAALNQHIFKVQAKPGTDQLFLRYLLEHELRALLAAAAERQTTMGHVRKADLVRLTCSKPPIEEQRAIAEVLGALDDRIEWCDAGVGLAYELQDALFVEMNALQLTRQPLGDFVQLDKGVSYKGADVTDDPSAPPLINLGNFGRGRAPRWEKLKRYTGQTRPRHRVSPGDVVVCATDMTHDRVVLGKTLVVPQRLADAAISHHLFVMRLRPDAPVSSWLVALALGHEPIRRVVAGFANGTTVLALPRDAVQRVEIPVPSPEQLAEFDASVAEFQLAIESANDEAATLRRIRDALLSRLLSGEVRIDDPARVLGAVA